MHRPKRLVFGVFQGVGDPLPGLGGRSANQSRYLVNYLRGLDAKRFILEPNYFDLDYLGEFSAFYAANAKGYSNLCRRVHYFSSDRVDEAMFNKALEDDEAAKRFMHEHYLGFAVLRPIDAALGRTVFRWYHDDKTQGGGRVTEPSREYEAHIAGLTLSVKGLAWQQQDSAVASCATIGIWSLLHSSALDYRHSIPTTTQITLAANNAVRHSRNAFPSTGLRPAQIQEAIRRNGLNPVTVKGNLDPRRLPTPTPWPPFSKERFASSCTAFLRSGYPALLIGCYADRPTEPHAVCATGFRDNPVIPNAGMAVLAADQQVDVLYLHDDNYGPNIRCRIQPSGGTVPYCQLVSDPPSNPRVRAEGNPDFAFVPCMLMVATHQEIRLDTDSFYREGIRLASAFAQRMAAYMPTANHPAWPLVFSCRFMMLKEYLATYLPRQIPDRKKLAAVRRALQEEVPPMSLHIGILRIAMGTGQPLMDVIYDTTEASPNPKAFCRVDYQPGVSQIAGDIADDMPTSAFVKAY